LIQVRDVRGHGFGALDRLGIAGNQTHRLPRAHKLSHQLRPDRATGSQYRLHSVSSAQAVIKKRATLSRTQWYLEPNVRSDLGLCVLDGVESNELHSFPSVHG
jgi:hypothetical protein